MLQATNIPEKEGSNRRAWPLFSKHSVRLRKARPHTRIAFICRVSLISRAALNRHITHQHEYPRAHHARRKASRPPQGLPKHTPLRQEMNKGRPLGACPECNSTSRVIPRAPVSRRYVLLPGNRGDCVPAAKTQAGTKAWKTRRRYASTIEETPRISSASSSRALPFSSRSLYMSGL